MPPAAIAVAPSGPTGWIEGRVTARGKLPALKPQPLDARLHKVCGDAAPDLSLIVAADGALQSAVVSIDDAPPAPLPSGFSQPFVDQKACLYLPVVIATRAGQSIKVKNSDPLMHNVRAMNDGKAVFNVAMPIENLTFEKPLPAAPSILRLHCDVHPWMKAWVATFAHDLYAVTDAGGRFRIDRVSTGRRPIKLWHPRLGEKRVEVEIQADAGTPLDVGWEVSDTGGR